jgi:Tfp pilus assembly protein PilO
MKQNLLILISGIFLVGFALLFLVVLPKYQVYQNLVIDLKQKQIDLRNKEDYYDNLNALAKELANHQEGLAKINTAFPTDPSLPSLFSFFLAIAAEKGLVVQNIGFGRAFSSTENYQIEKESINLQLSGSYPVFKEFLLALENSSRLFQTESLTLSRAKEGEQKDNFKFGLTVSTHFLAGSQ